MNKLKIWMPVLITLLLLSGLVLGQVTPASGSGSAPVSGSSATLKTDLIFKTGSTGTDAIDPTYNAINWGPATGGNQWWMSAKPNVMWRLGNNTTTYASVTPVDGVFSFPLGISFGTKATTAGYFESTGGATSTAFASASGQYTCFNTNATCTANIRETGGAVVLNGTSGQVFSAAGGAAGNIALTGSASVAVGKPLYFTAGLTAGYIVGDATGGVAIPTSTAATAQTNLGGSLSVNTTGVGNVGVSGPDDLQTYSLPANAITVTNRGVRIHAYGTTLNNANAKTIALNWGGQVLIAKALAPSIAGFWSIEATCYRTGASTQDCMAVADNHGGTTMSPTDGATTVRLATFTAGTQTETAIIVVKTTSTASTTNNDIISEGLIVDFF